MYPHLLKQEKIRCALETSELILCITRQVYSSITGDYAYDIIEETLSDMNKIVS